MPQDGRTHIRKEQGTGRSPAEHLAVRAGAEMTKGGQRWEK